MEKKSSVNLILDMDNTLIYYDTPRPYLETFLEYCFISFANVSIWTAGNDLWFEYVNNRIFDPIINQINKKHMPSAPFQFHFVFTYDDCSVLTGYESYPFEELVRKKLRRLHRSKTYSDYHIDNMIIVDDKSENFMCNYGNGIQIHPFVDGDGWNDDCLLRMIGYFKNIIIPYFNKHGTIRNLEKRGRYLNFKPVFSCSKQRDVNERITSNIDHFDFGRDTLRSEIKKAIMQTGEF